VIVANDKHVDGVFCRVFFLKTHKQKHIFCTTKKTRYNAYTAVTSIVNRNSDHIGLQ